MGFWQKVQERVTPSKEFRLWVLPTIGSIVFVGDLAWWYRYPVLIAGAIAFQHFLDRWYVTRASVIAHDKEVLVRLELVERRLREVFEKHTLLDERTYADLTRDTMQVFKSEF